MIPREMLDRHWLLGVARREREALGRTIQYTDLEAWENPSPDRGMPIADVLSHLAATEIAGAAALGDEEQTEVDEFRKAAGEDGLTLDGFSAWAIARRAEQPPVTTGLEWGRAADLLIRRADAVSDEDWRDKELPWFGGDLRLGYFLQYRVAQWWLHGQDILDGGGRPLRREHDPTFVVNDFAIRLVPYALSLALDDVPDLVVRVELEAVGGGVWIQRTRPGEQPADDADPDVLIGGRGPWFALVATGRADPELALYEGVVNVGGQAEIGERILRSLRAYP
jgi:uncharacterized protein (TIGR03083 family)